MDREKVIKGLNYCTHTDGVECPNCPYWQDDDCVEALNADALDLIHDLQSQIAMLVAVQHTVAEIMGEKQDRISIEQTLDETYGVTGGLCPTCGNWIQSAHSFCGFCGQPIGWKKRLFADGNNTGK